MKESEHSNARLLGDVQAVTFDVTGTLLHCPGLADLYCQALNRHGYSVTAEQVGPILSWVWREFSCQTDLLHRDRFTAHDGGARGFWHRYLERLCEHLDLAKPTRFVSAELYQSLARGSSWHIFADVEPALRHFEDAGLRLAVVSNWDERLPDLLESVGLSRYFESVVYSSDCGVEKPSARIFHECLERLGVEPSSALHVGDDKVRDVEGAQAAGMKAWHLDRAGGVSLQHLPEFSPALGPRRL